MSDHYSTILFDKKDRWANITLNRPEVKNALSEVMTDELMSVFRELKEDDFSNILERTSLGSNSRIAIPLAEEYLAMRQRRKDMKLR